MDGGGRFARPLTAAGISGAALLGRAEPETRLGRFLARFGRRRAFIRSGRRGPPRHLGSVLTVGFLAVVVGTGLVTGGHYDAMVAAHGRPLYLLGRLAGFPLDRVTISGIAGLREGEVLGAAGLDARTSLAFVGVAEVRERLKALPLVAAVSVRKIYPHELQIELVEREPAALWQRDGALFVVAKDGTVIDEMRDGRFANLPLVVGEGANAKVPDYLALVAAAGPLKDRVKAGTFVAGRRWTLKVDGVDVRLPEQGAAAAVARLVALQRDERVLDKDVIAIDLRMADRVVLRLTEEAAAARAELIKKRIAKGKGVET
jgi:cell division protein FtsQ